MRWCGKATKQAKGKMQIRRRHVDRILGSNSQSLRIGKPRADIVGHLELLRARGIAAQSLGVEGNGRSHRVELRGSVTTWLIENEEKVEGQPFLLRPGKMN